MNGIAGGLGWEDRPAVPLSLTKRGVGELVAPEDQPERRAPLHHLSSRACLVFR